MRYKVGIMIAGRVYALTAINKVTSGLSIRLLSLVALSQPWICGLDPETEEPSRRLLTSLSLSSSL